MDKAKVRQTVREYAFLTAATMIMVVGIYFFKFPNNFCFGGVTGFAVLFSSFTPFNASDLTFIMNMALLVVGFLFVGKSFGVKTVYVSVLMSVALSVLDKVYPLTKPMTNEPVLEFMFAVFLPALGSAMLFDADASSGGTDILAMILKKYTSFNIGVTLMLVDVLITVLAFVIYGPKTGLFSIAGLLAKTLVIDTVIENMNLCKYFTVVCDVPAPICDFIHQELNRSATVFEAQGSYGHSQKKVILTVMKRNQAVRLRRFIREQQPNAFIMITNSSEIIGKGFRGMN
ncbi:MULTISPECIES: YitT family protein [Caproicibacterium]|uniref:YitT family protein n=1 Tax=Caproicibacterium argilliputei TaxID=3030016 RepID=A0AA97H2W0_9FIRM|nr:YitT family protein [Caproicibacterium argilliputei]WOC31608.1 YitT family protein [Caproicibacterium argilliputei]